MATRKNRKSRGRKSRGRKMRGGEGNIKPVAEGSEGEVAPVAATVAATSNVKVNPSNQGNSNNVKPTTPPGAKEEGEEGEKPVGGKRKTRKGGRRISRGASKWNQFVMRTFKEMRKKNKDVKLMDAMKECSKQKKKGMKY